MDLKEMDTNSKQLIGFCHSCLRTKPLNVIMYSRRWFLSDSKENGFRDEYCKAFSQNVHEFGDMKIEAPHHYLAASSFDSWFPEENRSTSALVEWKTMETSMEDGLLGRAAVSRTSEEHTPWRMSRANAESSDNFPHFDSLHYGSRQDYKRRLRKASLIRELRVGTIVEGSKPEFFEGMCSKCLPEDMNPRSSDDKWLYSDMNSSQDEDESGKLYCCDEQEAASVNTPDTSAIERYPEESKDESESRELSESTTNLVISDESETEEVDNRKQFEGCHRRSVNFPPPLSSLVRKTSSFLPHQVPSVLLQPIRSNGRFILQEVHVATHTVFQPIREDGRLLLRLFRHSNSTSRQRNSSGKTGEDDITVAESPSDLYAESKIPTGVGDSENQLSQIRNEQEHLLTEAIAQLEHASNLNLTDNSLAKDPHQCNSGPLSNLEKIGSDHDLTMAQTMQQNMFQTLQHHHDRELHDQLVRNFAARALKLTLCREAITNGTDGKLASADKINPPDSISRIKVKSFEDDIVDEDKLRITTSSYEFLKDEVCPRETLPLLFQAQHKGNMRDGLDTQDPSIHQCRYKGNRRQGDESLMSRWEAHCIAT